MSIDLERKQIRIEATYTVEPVVVWETITTNAGLASFFAARADVDVRPGGRFHWQIPPAGPQAEMRVAAVEPGRRLVLEGESGTAGAGVTVFEFTVEPDGPGKTRLTLVHSGFGDDFAGTVDGVHWAWLTHFRRLRWVLEEGYSHQQHPYFGFHGGLLGMFLRVIDVVPGSPAEAAGLQPGDNIQRAGGLLVQGIDWPAEVFRRLKPGVPTELLVIRNWQPVTLTVVPEARPLGLGEGEAL